MGVMMGRGGRREQKVQAVRGQAVQAWLTIIAFVALTLWLLIGSVIAIVDHPSPRAVTPATAPDSEPVIYEETP